MTLSTKGGAAWRAAIAAVLAEPEGDEVRRAQGLWALALRTESVEGIRCDPDLLGPVLTPSGDVVMRFGVAVGSSDPDRTRDACDIAWRRFTRVDEYGAEAPPEEELPDPDPFGYPYVDGGWVMLGYDGRSDEEPYPHRALACLRILIEELRRHGCTPARLANPKHAPGDEDVDFEALADEAADARARTTSSKPAVPTQLTARPDWLPEFHHVARARPGRPTVPVPFVLLAGGNVYAWDPHRGLLRLPRPEPAAQAGSVSSQRDDLSPDGTRLRYLRSPGPESAETYTGQRRYHLITGEVTFEDRSRTTVYEAIGGTAVVRAERSPHDAAPAEQHERIELVRFPGASAELLPLRDRLSAGAGIPAVQFSPCGDLLATSHRGTASGRKYVARTELSTMVTREFDHAYLLGTASWSPDQTRFLIDRSGTPLVLDLRTGDTTRIDQRPIGAREPTSPAFVEPLGWLSEGGLLVAGRYERRIRLSYQPVDNSARHPILDIPVPASQANTLGIALAPGVLLADPSLVGYQGR